MTLTPLKPPFQHFHRRQTGAEDTGCKVFDPILRDGNDVNALKTMDIIITCQGGDYTSYLQTAARSGLEGPLD